MRSRTNKITLYLFVLFFIVSALIFYVGSNSKELYAWLGDINAKNNNVQKAINAYEKSYSLGNKDAKFRTSYINILINSPLSIDSQTKIAEFAEDEIKDSASQSAKYFLYNLKREIHNKYPDNYVKRAPYSGKIMHWGKLPITYTFKNTRGVPDELVEAVDLAFDEWERASSVRIKFDRVASPKADIIVSFVNRQVKSPKIGEKYVIAYTVPTVNHDRLEKMDMELSIYDIEGNLFSPNQMYNTSLHEIFHALGFLGHSDDATSIMYMTSDKNVKAKDDKKYINSSDKATLELLYKIKPDITNAHELKYSYIPYLILGSNTEINYAKKNEAKRYIQKAPSIPAGYIDYAQTLVNQKEYAKAITCLEKALRVAGDDATKYLVYYNLAVTHFYDGSFEIANVYLDRAKEIKDEPDLHILMAELFLKQNKQNEAIEEYKYLISEFPDNINFSISLANIYIKNKHYLKARKVLKEFLKRNPGQKKSPRLSRYKILLL